MVLGEKNEKENKTPIGGIWWYLTDEYAYACGHLAALQRITGREAGTSSNG